MTRRRELTDEEIRRKLIDDIPEKDFQANVVRYAKVMGWKVHYTTISYRSPGGWLDLFMIRGTEIKVAELKVKDGKTSEKQDEWVATFLEAGIPAFVWWPHDWPEIERELGRPL